MTTPPDPPTLAPSVPLRQAPALATSPALSARALRVRSGLLVVALVLFAVAFIALIASIIAGAIDPTVYNPFAWVLFLTPFTFVAGLNALIWRQLVVPISRSTSTRALFITLVTIALAVGSILLVAVLVVLSMFLPFA